MMAAAESLAPVVGVSAACRALNVPRSRLYRARQPVSPPAPRPTPERGLSETERMAVRDELNSERFQDSSPYQVFAALLDENIYLCSVRTMYRILAAHGEVRERRNQLQHPTYSKPELLATAPNQVWSWDITKLKGPVPWSYFYLYAILDIFSRYVVGWLIAERETAQLASELIDQTCTRQGISRDHLSLHADRGSPMRSQAVAHLLSELGVTKSHARPYTPDDNPFSESQFKTLKYRPAFPERFGSLAEARRFCQSFFHWYNHEHYHSGIGLLTPASVHYGQAETVIGQRNRVLQAAYQVHPERFVNGPPTAPELPPAVWINLPKEVPISLIAQ
jgi:putative transposase